MIKDLRDFRENYTLGELLEKYADDHPFQQFSFWLDEYQKACQSEVNAMTLVTQSKVGPVPRVVLLKQLDARGFVFYTNYNSRKSLDMQNDPRVGLLFFWPELQRQVRVQGVVERVSEDESDAYFASRPRESSLGAWGSPQSEEIASREILEERYREAVARFEGQEVPRPEHWGGYRVLPSVMEFWQGRPSRLHDRLEYVLDNGEWKRRRLAP